MQTQEFAVSAPGPRWLITHILTTLCLLCRLIRSGQLFFAIILILSSDITTAQPDDQPCKVANLTSQDALWVTGTNPTVDLWQPSGDDLWQPPSCIPWVVKPARVVVTTLGRFQHTGNVDEILKRFADVSDMTSIQYWSVTKQKWKPLFKQSHALDPEENTQRDNFQLQELMPGHHVQVQQTEAYLPAPLTLDWQILERTPDRLVITMTNTSDVKWMFSRVIAKGNYEFFYLLERETGSTWRFYNVSRLTGGNIVLSLLPNESYINRAAAIFRYVAGYPTDIEPPVAPARL
jgi:hypothetical protein